MRKCSEMPYHIGLKAKIYPNYKQKRVIAKNCGASRFVYNRMVGIGNEIWRLKKTAAFCPSDRQRIEYLSSVRKSAVSLQNSAPFLYDPEIDSNVVLTAMKNYRTAWKNMREQHRGVPTFHKRKEKQSYQTSAHYAKASEMMNDGSIRILDRHRILIPKIGRIRFDASPKLIDTILSMQEGTRISTVTVLKDAVGEYWVSMALSSEHSFRSPLEKTGACIGIDLNLSNFLATSDGELIPNPRYLQEAGDDLNKIQYRMGKSSDRNRKAGRHLCECRNYQKLRRKYAYQNRMVCRQRNDFQHVISKRLVENQDLIVAEDLKVRILLKNHHLARAISDAGWTSFLTKISQKATMYGKTFLKVPAQYTTQTCAVCGHICTGEDYIPLGVEEWICPSCGAKLARDPNAAVNILRKGLTSLGLATG